MKYYGKIGFIYNKEDVPGVWKEVKVERYYYGDVTTNTRRISEGVSLNDDITINNTFSIVADAYAYNNFFAMKYIEWMGVYWKISSISVQSPRLELTVSEIYNLPYDESEEGQND